MLMAWSTDPDFIAWNGNKFTSSDQVVSALDHANSAVPEPGGWVMVAMSLLGMVWLRNKNGLPAASQLKSHGRTNVTWPNNCFSTT